MSRVVFFIVAMSVVAACGPRVDHPSPSDALEADGEVVGSINARSITAEEIRLLAARTGIDDPEELKSRLVERELLVDHALEKGANPGISHARKRAMVRALLADEIESEVTTESVDVRLVNEILPRVAAELRGPGAERAVAIFIGPRTRKRKEAEKLAEQTKARADEVYAWLAEDPTAERLVSFDVSTVKPPIGAKVNRSMIVVNPVAPEGTKPDGWIRNDSLFGTLRAMEIGEMSELIPLGFGYAILIRQGPIEPDSDVSDETVEQKAREKARDALRTTHLEKLLRRLREDADIDKYPALIEQQHRQTP